MSKTAYLRPLITTNFIFDFPSQFKTKDLSEFDTGDFHQVAKNANENMQEIMQGNEVLWYIQSKSTKKIVGWIKFIFKNDDQTNANFECKLTTLSNSELIEIAERIEHICVNNLKLEIITISSSLNDIICQQLKNQYNMDNNKLTMR